MMNMPTLELPNVSGKTVERIALYDDPASGRELTIRFTDGTELSVMMASKQLATVRHFDVVTDKTIFERNEAELQVPTRA